MFVGLILWHKHCRNSTTMHKQILLLLLFLFFASFTDASAQQAKKVSRIGYLSPLSTSGSAASLEAKRVRWVLSVFGVGIALLF